MDLHLVIANPNREFCEIAAWRFRDYEMVEVFQGKFEEVNHFDCVVTAGNSFGLMDAGMDLAVVKYFGIEIQEKIQAVVLEQFLGEQPVGTSFLVETGDRNHPYVAHTPTMRVPLNLNFTDNIYLATWASLLAIHHHNQSSDNTILTAVFPAFGVGTGGVDGIEASYQMKLAYENYLNPPQFLNGSFAQQRHEKVHYGTRYGFENPRIPESL